VGKGKVRESGKGEAVAAGAVPIAAKDEKG